MAGWVPSCPPTPPVLVPSVFLPCIFLPSPLLSSPMTQASAPAPRTPPHLVAPLTLVPPLQAQRNNEDVSIIPPLFTVSVDHRVSGLKGLAPFQGKWQAHSKPYPLWGLGHCCPVYLCPRRRVTRAGWAWLAPLSVPPLNWL